MTATPPDPLALLRYKSYVALLTLAAIVGVPVSAAAYFFLALIDKLQGFYGFTRMPFGRDLAPGMLHRHAAHNEAVARIGWCVTERRIGVITGEVGAGKTVAVRAALAALDASRHSVIYLPNPTIGVRGIHHQIVAALA